MPAIRHILETGLYVEDLDRAAAFYRDVLGLPAIAASPRLIALDGGASTVLLLMLRGAMVLGGRTTGGFLPAHDGQGSNHLAFAVTREELAAWERHLEERGVAIESRVQWELGGISLYFRDPDGHLVELATPGVWKVY